MNKITVSLTQNQYNSMFSALVVMKGPKSKFAASTLIEQIQQSVITNKTDDNNLPASITLEIDSKVLEGVFLGLGELTLDEKVSAGDLKLIGALAKTLKMSGRYATYINKHIESIPESDPTEMDSDSFDD